MRLTSPSGGRAACAAFTLIELLTVIAIIGILAAITFGVSRGVNERAAINQARAELSVLASALEAYKRQYGDYPQAGINSTAAGSIISPSSLHATSITLFNALQGWKGPKNNNLDKQGKTFVTLGSFSLANATIPTSGVVDNAFVDPWGRPYFYSYRTDPSTQKWSSYILLSAGPDGKTGITSIAPTSGVITYNATSGDNLDNIQSN